MSKPSSTNYPIGQKYYLIYQPLGLMDWSIIGIVPTGVVDSGMRRVQNATILVIALDVYKRQV